MILFLLKWFKQLLFCFFLFTSFNAQAEFINCGGPATLDAGQSIQCHLNQKRWITTLSVSPGCNDGEFGHYIVYFDDGSKREFIARCHTKIDISPRFVKKMSLYMLAGGGGDNHISWTCCGSQGWGVRYDPNVKLVVQTSTDNITVEVGSLVNFNGSFTGLDENAPYTYTWEFGEGNSILGTVNTLGEIPADYTYLQPGQFTATLTVKDRVGNTSARKINVHVVPAITDDPCTPSVITLRSDLPVNTPIGLWHLPITWDGKRVPSQDDWILIRAGHTVLLPPTGQINVKGICIEQEGVLHSAFNVLSNPPTRVNIYAAAIHNQGEILGAPGSNGGLLPEKGYQQATDGSDIKIHVGRFINDTTGVVSANGRGGDDILYNYYETGSGVLNAVGGNGGNLEIYPVVFVNEGSLQSGHGGDGDTFDSWKKFVYGNAYGGHGGIVRVFSSNLALSSNGRTGQIRAGDGGDADGISNWLRDILAISRGSGRVVDIWQEYGNLYKVKRGQGGTVSLNLGDISGVIQGSPGKQTQRTLIRPTEVLWVEPTTMKMDETTRFDQVDNIVLFGGHDWVMDLTKLSPGAIQANQTIRIAVGEGSTIDLRGVAQPVLVADESVDFYADTILLDKDTTLEQIVTAAEINVYPSKILYHVELSYENFITDKPSTTVPIKLTVLNSGPTQDSYTIEVLNTKGWQITPLPQQVTV